MSLYLCSLVMTAASPTTTTAAGHRHGHGHGRGAAFALDTAGEDREHPLRRWLATSGAAGRFIGLGGRAQLFKGVFTGRTEIFV